MVITMWSTEDYQVKQHSEMFLLAKKIINPYYCYFKNSRIILGLHIVVYFIIIYILLCYWKKKMTEVLKYNGIKLP